MRIILILLFPGIIHAAEPSLELQILELRKANNELYKQVLELSYEKNQRIAEEIKIEYDKKKAEEEKKLKEKVTK